MSATIVQSGEYALEIDTGDLVRSFTLDDPVKGKLDNPTFVLDGATGYADVTDGAQRIEIRRGRRDTSDQFQTGIMNFILDDTAAGGVFNPFANQGPYYDTTNTEPGLAPMRQVRLKRENELLFVGRVIDYSYNFGLDGNDTVEVTCADDFYLLAQAVIDDLHIDKEFSGERIETILDLTEVNYPSGAARDIATGTVELGGHTGGGGGGHDYDIELGTIALDYLRLVNAAERGRLFVDREGVLVFQERIGQTLSNPVVDFNDDGTNYPYRNVDISFGADKVVNLVFVQSLANDFGTASDSASQAKYFVQTASITGSLLDTNAACADLADYLLNPEPEATFTAVEVAFSQLTDGQRDTISTVDIGDTISIEKEFINGATTTQLAQELAVEGIEHRIDTTAGHVVRFYTSAVTIVYELILDDAVYGVLDSTNVLG